MARNAAVERVGAGLERQLQRLGPAHEGRGGADHRPARALLNRQVVGERRAVGEADRDRSGLRGERALGEFQGTRWIRRDRE